MNKVEKYEIIYEYLLLFKAKKKRSAAHTKLNNMKKKRDCNRKYYNIYSLF